ncbi:hypothetical protein Cgig2_023320 [Carnegiea gigantea]|uniref:Uncharacterized protein n=1 Tax=Carnegiea gigantea TaxID=171969 RepID=A0A9Q1QBV1_9CARY|nr:hypothetical protein Cgig2_023320 [Carnegiea gigantea]
MPTGFGGMLAVRARLIPKRLARWLLESYDPWETSLKLPNGKVLIYEEDVHATLGLLVGPLEVREAKALDNDTEYATFLEHWRQRWNIEREGHQLGEAEASDLGTISTPEVCISKDQDKHTTAPQAQEEHQTTQMPHQGCHPPTTDMACLNENHTDCLAIDDTFYYST